MTEEEAKTKWCPMVHAIHYDKDDHCLGSGCMMWRWNDEYTLQEGHVLPDIKQSTTDGWCGLGGKP